MDKYSTLKLTPIEPEERKNSGDGAVKYEMNEQLRRVLERQPRPRLSTRGLAGNVRGSLRRAGGRITRRARTSSARTKGAGKIDKIPFVTTLKGQIAICSGVILLALALKAADTPKAQTVSATVGQAITTETNLDQNLGKLQFVQNMFSESIAVFWQQKPPASLQSPFNGRLSARYGLSTPGIEITGRESGVFACYEGKVLSVDTGEDGSVTVVIQHTGGLETVYARLAASDVKAKEKVKAGQKIGAAQAKGDVFAMFLQVRLDGVVVDPLSYFQN